MAVGSHIRVANANFQLRVVSVTGGPPITLASPGAGSGGGAAWAGDGWIYFDTPGGLARIRADGGAPEPFVTYDSASGEIGHAWPEALPNGKGLILPVPARSRPVRFQHRGVRSQDPHQAHSHQGAVGALCRSGVLRPSPRRWGRSRGTVRPGSVEAHGTCGAAVRRGDEQALRLGRHRHLIHRHPGLRSGPGLECGRGPSWCMSPGKAPSRRSIPR